MCSFGSNQSAPTSQFSSQTTTASPQAQAMYNSAWKTAQQTAQRPFQPYSYDPNAFVAPMNSTQLTAVNNIYGMQNAGQPFYQAAPGMAYNAGNTSSAGLAGAYMSPYLDSVAASTMGILGQQQAQDRNRLAGQIAANGQWSNDRSGIERATLAGQQNLATANTISNLYNTGYNTALGAAQTDLNRQLQASGALAGQGLQGAQSLLQAGTLGQQTQQAGLQALYNQYLMQQQYPFQTAQFLASTAAGLGPGYGGTTSGYQNTQQPLSFFGNPLSDPHLKVGAEGDEPEVIGQTNDGQDIYRYRVINPDTGEVGPVQIGLMADEVEQRRPDAIGDYKGYRTVDYAKATDDAARLGGGVMGRGDYADGGGIDDLLRSHEAMYAGLGKMPGGIVPQSQMTAAKLDTPSIRFSEIPKRESYGIGQMANDALGLIQSGKGLYNEGKGVYDWVNDKRLLSGPSAETPQGYWGKAEGGSVYDATPELTQGPISGQMPTAHLDAPKLSFGSSGNEQGTGIGDMVKGAAGLAGAAKTLFDIGSTVGPMVMALSDRRLKTGVRPGYATEGGVKPDIEDILGALSDVESSGRYGVVGPASKSGDRAYGKYQVMGANVPSWTKEAGLGSMTSDEFLKNPDAQDAVARHRMGIYLDKAGGDEAKAASMWFGGPGYAKHAGAKDVLGTTIPAYASRFQSALDKRRGGLGTAMTLAAPETRPSNPGIDAMPGAKSAPSDDTAPAAGLSGFLRGTPASGLGEKAMDFATSERFLIPLLTGLGTMASSGSRFFAPALLQGLGAGAKSYMEIPKTQAETAKLAEEARTQAAETAARAMMAPKIGAETQQLLANTAETKARTAKEQAEMINSAIVERGGRLFVRVVKSNGLYDLVPFGEWNAMDPGNRPPLAPGASGGPTVEPATAAPASGAQAAPAPSKTDAANGFDVTPEHAVAAQKAAAMKSGWSTTNQAAVPDFFAPQADIAKSAQDQKQIIIPLASSLAQLPKGSSLLASGKAQEFLSPFAATLNNLASVAGFKGLLIADPKALANQEEVKKLVTQLQREATTSSQMHAYHAFKDMAEGIPGIFTSPEGQGKLIAQIMTNTQRQIDKNDFFSKWAKAAGGKNGSYGEWARLTSPEANMAFDNDKGTNARYASDREALEKMFKQQIILTDANDEPVLGSDGMPQKISLLAAIATHPDILKEPKYRKAFEEKYPPSILRYFGIQ